MMTMIIRLCLLSAVSSLMEMIVSKDSYRMRMRLICGLLMMRLLLSEMIALGISLSEQKSLSGILNTLIR